jgi:hypothetical protein
VADVLGYDVLVANGRPVAVPRGALTPGAGGLEFSMVVEDVLDLVEYRELVGEVGGVRVHVVLPAGGETPARGARVAIHAERFSDLSDARIPDR